MNEFELSEDQQVAHDKILAWIENPVKQMFTLSGVAGSGKSFLVGQIVKHLIIDIAYATYTGKASTVLREKFEKAGVTYSFLNTIHSLIYNPMSTDNGGVEFVLKDALPYDLILLDEASMIGTQMFKDLESFGIPILFVGDEAQLPPVNDTKGLDLENADAKLTKIHRQSEGNAIIRLSADIREGRPIPFGQYADNVRVLNKKDETDVKFLNNLIANFNPETDIILCGYNTTRVALNKAVRSVLGYKGNLPQKGERVICLKNNKELDIYNGTMGTITSFTPNMEDAVHRNDGEVSTYTVGEFVGDFDTGYAIGMCLESQFLNKTPLGGCASAMDKTRGSYEMYYNLLDYAYAISVFKSQGSEFKNVIVFEESSKLWEQKKWNYTAVTRAVDNLYFISDV